MTLLLVMLITPANVMGNGAMLAGCRWLYDLIRPAISAWVAARRQTAAEPAAAPQPKETPNANARPEA